MPSSTCFGRDELLQSISATLERRGVAVVGPPGMGVSTVLRVLAERHVAAGGAARVVRLPDGRTDVFKTEPDTLLVVDDAHAADDEQLAALRDRAIERPVLLGVRSGAATPALEWLWMSGAIERVDLEQLTRKAIARLARAHVGARVDRPLVEGVTFRWGGRPAFIVDDLQSLRDGGHLHTFGGATRANPEAPIGVRALDRARQLVDDLSPKAARDVKLLATVGAPPVEMLARLDLDVHELRRRRLIVNRHRGDTTAIRLDPPWLAPAVRAILPPAELVDLAGSIDPCLRTCLEPIDTVRLSDLTGDPIELETMIAAARAALRQSDLPVALRLARLCSERGQAGAAVEAEIMVEAGMRADAAERYRALLDDAAVDPALQVTSAIEYSLLLLWDLERPDEAAVVADGLSRSAAGGPFAPYATAHQAAVTMFRGRPRDALTILDQLPESDVPIVMLDSVRMVRTTSTALLNPGSISGPASVAQLLESIDDGGSGPFETAVSVIAAVLALELAGDITGASATLAQSRARMAGHFTPVGTAWIALAEARLELAIGRPERAKRASLEAFAGFRDVTHPTGMHWAASASLFAGALARDRETCATGLAEFAALGPGIPFLDGDVLRARAWAHWATGDSTIAASLMRDSIEHSATTGCVALEALALHDSFRLFRGSVRTRLHQLAAQSPAPAIVLRARHVDCVANGDAPGLLELCSELEQVGLVLIAAEVAGDAARMAAAAGLRSTARTAIGERARLVGWCRSAATPSLDDHRPAPLTVRERDIALLAGDGMSSRDIADDLGLSVRTVNNLLQRVYVKLGIHGRSELAIHLK